MILFIRYYLFVFDDNFIINIVLTPLTRSTGTAGDTLAVAGLALWTRLLAVLLAACTLLVSAPVIAAVAPLLVAGTEIVSS